MIHSNTKNAKSRVFQYQVCYWTEVVYLSSRFSETVPIPSINVGDSVVNTVAKAKDLSALIDQHLTLVPHVNNISRLVSHSVRNIGRIRKYLDRNITEKLVHAFCLLPTWLKQQHLVWTAKIWIEQITAHPKCCRPVSNISKKHEHIYLLQC